MCKGKFDITGNSDAMKSPSMAWVQVGKCEECEFYHSCQYVADMQDLFNTCADRYPINNEIKFIITNDLNCVYTSKERAEILDKMVAIKFYLNVILLELAFQNKTEPLSVDDISAIEVDLSSASDEFYLIGDNENDVRYHIEFVTKEVGEMNDRDFLSDYTVEERKQYELGGFLSYYTLINDSDKYVFREM